MATTKVDWMEMDKKYHMSTFKRIPLVLVRGEGVWLWDENDRKFLDFFAGFAVCCLGHSHPVMTKAIQEQASKLIQVSQIYYTIPQYKLADILMKNSCLNKIFYQSSGSEACEGAVKLARRYGMLKLNGAYEVITMLNSWHGRTLAMTAATGQSFYQNMYLPLPPGFRNVPYNDIEAVKAATNERTCAVMLELVQGEGGVNPADPDYVKQLRAWCDEKGILLILDEVQTGIARTGTMFAYQQYGIEPDIMTLAKGMGGGVPISAFLCKDNVNVFASGNHGGTYCGNPLMCAVSYAVIKYIVDNDICGNVQKVGKHFVDNLKGLQKKHPILNDVRGKGLLLGLGLSKNASVDVMNACMEEGLLVNAVKPNTIRLAPPLIITSADADTATGMIDRALTKVESK
ncbi:MAG: aspartate aminotransferase family protein [Chloroflexota bacterium]